MTNRLLALYVLILTLCSLAVATLTPNDADRWLRFAYSTVAALASAIAAGLVLANWSKKQPRPTRDTATANMADLPFSSVEDRPTVQPAGPMSQPPAGDHALAKLGITTSFERIREMLATASRSSNGLALKYPLAEAILSLRLLENEIRQQIFWMQAGNQQLLARLQNAYQQRDQAYERNKELLPAAKQQEGR